MLVVSYRKVCYLGDFVFATAVSITSFLPEKVAEVEAFFKEHPIHGVERGIHQMLESMHVTSAFAERMAQGPMAKDSFWSFL